jgi:hypothetical protein
MSSSKLFGALVVTMTLGGCSGEAPRPASSEPSESVGRVSSKVTQLTLGPDNTWTWYDAVPGAMCADGSATGFAVNPLSTGNGKVLVFLDGGGICADANTCKGPFKTATHFNYGASTFASEMTSASSKSESVNLALFGSYTWSKTLGARGIWDRTSSSNPFRNYNFVFIPQCTADMFWGDRHDTSSAFPGVRSPSQQWFMGFSNVGIFAQQVQGFWPSPPSVTLMGGSAGGYGIVYNYPQLKSLYPQTPFNVVADSATPFWTGDDGFTPRQGFFLLNFQPPGVPSYEEDWFADAWGLDSTHPAGVTAVTRTGAQRSIYPVQNALIAVAAETGDQFGFLQGSNDWVTPWYLHLNVNGFSHPNVADGQADFSAHVTLSHVHTHFVTTTADPNPNLRVWNQHHGYVLDDVSMWTQTGVLPWLTQTFSL